MIRRCTRVISSFAFAVIISLSGWSMLDASPGTLTQQSKLGQQAEQDLKRAKAQVTKNQAKKPGTAPGANASARSANAAWAKRAGLNAVGAPALMGRAPLRRRQPRGPVTYSSEEVEFTFAGNTPGVDIFINRRKIGTTDNEGKLVVKLRSGLHRASMIRAGYFTQTRQVQVQPEQNTFNFRLLPSNTSILQKNQVADTRAENARPAVERAVTQNSSLVNATLRSEGAPTANDAAASANAATAFTAETAISEVMNRFFDPQQTNSVMSHDWQRVVTETKAQLALNPDSEEAKARQFFAAGQLSFLQRNHADALIAFRNAAQAMPKSVLGHYGIGNVYLATSQFSEALEAYKRALQIDPKFAMAYRGVGDVLNNLGDPKQAMQNYQRARDLKYFSPSMAMSMGRIMADRKEWAAALDYLGMIPPEQQHADALLLMGDVYARLKKPDNALDAYTRATKLNDRLAVGFYKLGESQFRRGQYVQAVESLERALVLDAYTNSLDRARVRKTINEAQRKAR
ncbi:MAG: tetratricopeptide repeat protein [Pyrinomonadaceae bacterium]|nr:tetratricopeptide repeat protein [Pyrinomonadaceae bacterium]